MIDVGQQVGGYTILSRIGRGGMGDVFLAQHRRVARRAAVKVLVPELSQKAPVLERFFNEARATSLIKHPGIVEILDCDVLDGQAFIIMEFLEGENLGAYLQRTGPLLQDLSFLFGAGLAVAGAVGAAHATQIIHRDLKPDNIYLHLPSDHDPTVTVKILDFGIAKLVQADGGHGQTSTGMVLGTPAYMSPEQCRGAGRVDARSDVYSLGCILYEAICGEPPFVREGMGDLIIAHVSEIPQPPVERQPSLPGSLNELIVRMLAKRPEDRPRSMDDVAEQLRACAHQLGVPVDQRLRPAKPVERPRVAVETAPTPVAVPPLGTGPQRTVPLAPRQGSGPVGGTRAAPTAALSAVPAAQAGVGSAAVRGGGDVDDGGDFSAPQPQSRAGGTRVLEPQRTSTTLSATASEIDARRGASLPSPPARRSAPRLIVLGGGVVLAGAIAIIMATRPRHASTGAAAPSEPPTAIVEPPPPPPAPAPEKPVVAPAVPSTVRIDIPGVPQGTTVTVDGQAASFPLELARGPAEHRIVVKPPGRAEKVLTLDGTRDRLIELVFEPPAADNPERKGKASEKSHRRAGGAGRERTDGTDKKPASAADREAITDI